MPDLEWKSVSASQAPALLNRSPYFTRWQLHHAFRRRDRSLIEPEPNARMDLGKLYQPLILKRAAQVYRLDVVENEADEYLRDGRLGCTLDAHMDAPDRGRMAVEAKRVHWLRWKQTWTETAAPPDIEVQLQAQLAVTGWSHGLIVCDNGDDELLYYEREANKELIERLRDEARLFFAALAADKEPDPLGSPLELPMLANLYPETDPKKIVEIMDDEDLALAVRQFDQAREAEGFNRKLAEQCRAKLLGAAGDAAILRVNGATCYIKKIPVAATLCQPHTEAKVTRRASIQTRIEVVKTDNATAVAGSDPARFMGA